VPDPSHGPAWVGRAAARPRAFLRARASWAVATVRERAWLVGITALGFAVRLAFVLGSEATPIGDPLYYHLQANLVAKRRGFLDASAWYFQHKAVPGADHPPLMTVWLAAWSALGLHSARWHLVASAVIGSVTIALVYATAKVVAGKGAAIAAGLLAALWPNLIYWNVGGYAESIAATCVALFCLLGVRYLQRPSAARLAAVGGAAALAGLARAELLLLLVGVVPLALAADPLTRAARVRWAAAAVGTAMLVVLPWAAYNQTRFADPVPLSTGLGLVLVSSNCNQQYYGPSIGYWSFTCSISGQVAARSSERTDRSLRDARMRDVAVGYAGHHPSRLPAVAAARLGRAFGVFQPFNSVSLGQSIDQISPWVGGTIAATWWLGMALAVAGAVALRRAGQHLSPYLTPVAVLAATAVLTYGSVRFRAPIEPAVLVLAGVAVELARRKVDGVRAILAAQAAQPPPEPAVAGGE